MAAKYESNSSIANFVEYLKIPSVQPNINYDDCVNFLKKQAKEIGLAFNVYEVVPTKPVVVLTWPGKNPALPSILLNSHMDVVPVFEFPRSSRSTLLLSVVLSLATHLYPYLYDEEIGGHDGMEKFVETKEFKALNVDFALDEGMASPNDDFIVYNGERSIWQIHVHCTGQPGHGSLLLPNTAGEKIRHVINRFMDYREEQKKILDSNPKLTIGDVTTINLTQLFGGVQSNVVPEKLTAVFDIRLAVTVNHTEFEAMINQWCKEAGEGITLEYEQKNTYVECTKIDGTNPYWVAFKTATDEMKLKLDCRIFPGGTDSRYIRKVGIPAIGFSPMNHTPVLLHDHDEFLEAGIFLKGIDIYVKILTSIANV
ncbi:aminoacylase-1 isoform X2 [Manduca sexta]|uniref:N-acyl-aliphatic-L-amino acid amidohydrolase n=2 Tax=Manduca sexta TaxID=7130 RepID=A0A921ZGL7_MANSE|nr:aminoacylase-1 isoform X2 [Manduca sexta]KAG6456639.1 hypothetical protein O3G_MSEX009848 [Manduca sexta]